MAADWLVKLVAMPVQTVSKEKPTEGACPRIVTAIVSAAVQPKTLVTVTA